MPQNGNNPLGHYLIGGLLPEQASQVSQRSWSFARNEKIFGLLNLQSRHRLNQPRIRFLSFETRLFGELALAGFLDGDLLGPAPLPKDPGQTGCENNE